MADDPTRCHNSKLPSTFPAPRELDRATDWSIKLPSLAINALIR